MATSPIHVLHAVGWYFPESSGGTEVYVDALATQLARRYNVRSSIVAASDAAAGADYQWTGHPVHRYHVPPALPGEFAGRRPHAQFEAFERWLRDQRVDVYHQHSWTRGCGASHLRLAKQLGLRTVLTVHVPSVICLRGTMMLHGEAACDGHVERARCTECWGASRGIPGSVSQWQARHPEGSASLGRVMPRSRVKTMLQTPELVAERIEQLAEIGRLADRVVAVSRWLEDALVLNGLPRQKVFYSAQGVDPGRVRDDAAPRRRDGRPYRVGFLGRWDPVKGIHTLVQAMRQIPADLPIELKLYALPGDRAYEQRVRQLAAGDERIRFEAPLARESVSAALEDIDLLAVPSEWLETGPLVALEAFAAGRPVLGSDLGGLKELVIPGVNGRLVPAGDVAAWSAALLEMMLAEPFRIPRPRTTDSVAGEMRLVYDRVLADR